MRKGDEGGEYGTVEIVVGGLVGSVTVGMLLGILVVVAVLRSNKRRRREKRKEIERKVYEKKALRVVSMVADSRVFFACATRTLLDSLELDSRPRSALAQGVPDPSSDVRDPRAAPARDLFLVRHSIRQLASDDQCVPDQATKDIRDPIKATRSIPARVSFVSSSRLNSFGGPIQKSSKVK
ncbi:hypothetical protein F2Q70_00001562, partial [Brassica cretica]